MPRRFGQVHDRPGRAGWYIEFAHKGTRVRRRILGTKPNAERKLRAIQVALENGGTIELALASVLGEFYGPDLTFADAVPLYLEYAAKRKKASTVKVDGFRLRAIAEESWAKQPLGAVTTEQIGRWLDAQHGRISPSSINRYRAAAGALFKWARVQGYVEESPLVRGALETLKEPPGREVFLDHDEAHTLLDACEEMIRPVVLTALLTGMRRGELLALRWPSVDLKRRQVRVEADTAKTGRSRVVRMPSTLWRALGALPRDESGYVFTFAPGQPLREHHLRYRFLAARDRTDLPLAKRDMHLHDCRHTAASWMVGEGIPLYDVAKILGHESIAITMRYAHFAPEAGQRAADALERAWSQSATTNGTTKRRKIRRNKA